jgi:hypothetical protein
MYFLQPTPFFKKDPKKGHPWLLLLWFHPISKVVVYNEMGDHDSINPKIQ